MDDLEKRIKVLEDRLNKHLETEEAYLRRMHWLETASPEELWKLYKTHKFPDGI